MDATYLTFVFFFSQASSARNRKQAGEASWSRWGTYSTEGGDPPPPAYSIFSDLPPAVCCRMHAPRSRCDYLVAFRRRDRGDQIPLSLSLPALLWPSLLLAVCCFHLLISIMGNKWRGSTSTRSSSSTGSCSTWHGRQLALRPFLGGGTSGRPGATGTSCASFSYDMLMLLVTTVGSMAGCGIWLPRWFVWLWICCGRRFTVHTWTGPGPIQKKSRS